jgi:N utilization substance protein A
MSELTFDNVTLGLMQIFAEETGVQAKDCIVAEGKVVFLVMPGEVRKVVGAHGERIDNLKARLKREIQVVEFSKDTQKLIMNVFYPFSPENVVFEPRGKGRHATVTVAEGWKARAIGKAGRNLKIARALISRHSDVVSVNVA